MVEFRIKGFQEKRNTKFRLLLQTCVIRLRTSEFFVVFLKKSKRSHDWSFFFKCCKLKHSSYLCIWINVQLDNIKKISLNRTC